MKQVPKVIRRPRKVLAFPRDRVYGQGTYVIERNYRGRQPRSSAGPISDLRRDRPRADVTPARSVANVP